MGRSRGVRGERTKTFRRTLAGFGRTWNQKVHFSTFDGKLKLQCTRNGSQNPPYCPGSLQDTFIIYSSISHQHVFQKYCAKNNIATVVFAKSVVFWAPVSEPGFLDFQISRFSILECFFCLGNHFWKSGGESSREK